jgi:hypothetical protein
MIQTKETDVNLLEAEFYEKPFNFSYSSLNTLLVAPAVFYKEYILQEKEEEFRKYLLEGIIIHYLVLENQGFDDKFIVSAENLPSANNIAVAEAIFKLTMVHHKDIHDETLELCDFENEIEELLQEMNLHQSVKDPVKRIAKVVEPRTEAYFTFLKNRGNKTIIDSALLDKCTRRAEIVTSNPDMRVLLGLDLIPDNKIFGVYNELPIEVDKENGIPFGYKGRIDNLVVNVQSKTVHINDFKTTSKTLNDFSDSVDFWNYWLQAAMYVKLVRKFLSEVITEDWNIEFRFVVFDKYDQLYAFLVSEDTMKEWTEKLTIVEKEALYHYESRDFTLPYNFAQGIVNL